MGLFLCEDFIDILGAKASRQSNASAYSGGLEGQARRMD